MHPRLDEALSHMILSPSGWRGIFAEDGDEESAAPGISQAHRTIAAAAARVFAAFAPQGAIIVGRDSRPTGQAIAAAVIGALRDEGRELRYTGVAAAPEIMSLARLSLGAAGFIYISASHNPIGHNGIKFGLTDGGVLQAQQAAELAAALRALLACPSQTEKCAAGDLAQEAADWKSAALAAYRDFAAEIISGTSDRAMQEELFSLLRKGIENRPLGIAVDFNGSARTLSIDRDFFTALGAGFFAINEESGRIVHRIVPEGESLTPCRQFLEELRRHDPSVTLGYVPDCDGDRGNLVIWDNGQARILEAQEVFALACAAELSFLVWNGTLRYGGDGELLTKAAIAVNDPTSLRIDRIAQAFGLRVFRAEVGEANVVGLARQLREQGYLVRILGEGSSGGTIIHPSAVRDPITTVGAILKLLAIRQGGQAGMGLFQIWLQRSGSGETYRENFTLADVIASLPAFVTTGIATDQALLKVKSRDHALLKAQYQRVFLREWEEKKAMLKTDYGISTWEAIAYNGIQERRGISRFSDAGSGGLKIELGSPESKTACIWMRGSATEPVFRIMADVSAAGGQTPARHLETFLIEWQRRMVLEADSGLVRQLG